MQKENDEGLSDKMIKTEIDLFRNIDVLVSDADTCLANKYDAMFRCKLELAEGYVKQLYSPNNKEYFNNRIKELKERYKGVQKNG